MKKLFVNFKALGFVAVVATAMTVSSCNNVKCSEANDDNYNSTTNNCDEAATSGKFVGNWTGTPGSYPFNVSAGTAGDYLINVSTNLGLTDGSGNPLTPANVNGWQVTKNQATITGAALFNGTVTGTVSYISASSMSITYTLAGYGAGVDGSYTESLAI